MPSQSDMLPILWDEPGKPHGPNCHSSCKCTWTDGVYNLRAVRSIAVAAKLSSAVAHESLRGTELEGSFMRLTEDRRQAAQRVGEGRSANKARAGRLGR